ncbi:DUF1990 domain-containing protein [soil metagenome]
MFLLTKPALPAIEQFLIDSSSDKFSYPEIGATKSNSAPPGYNIDHNRVKLGSGPAAFERAKSAIIGWKMFDLDWVELIVDNTPIEIDQTVAILVHHFSFYSLNAARIVYTLDEAENFGFAYGTLTEHGEIGEERFSVEIDPKSGEVWYDLYAFSRPVSLLALAGYPLSRHLQKSFARDSKRAMFNAVSDSPSTPQNS